MDSQRSSLLRFLGHKLDKLRPDAKSGVFPAGDATSSGLSVDKNTLSSSNDSPDSLDWRLLEKSLQHGDPLREVVKELAKCSKMFEVQLDGGDEYAASRGELKGLFEELQECCNKAMHGHIVPLHVTKALEWFCRSVHSDLSYLREKEVNGGPKQPGEMGNNKDHVLVCCRRIQSRLKCIALNVGATASIWDSFHDSSPAYYNSPSRIQLKRGPCTKGTRVNVINQILSWTCSSSPSSVYWMSGMAGTGKTAIAYSLCKELDASHRLAASFFCSRLRRGCQDVSLIIPSIAYQLAEFSHPFHLALSRVFQGDLGSRSPLADFQFNVLIAQPLLEVEHTLPDNLVVVIDALDECDNKEQVELIVDTLLARSSDLPVKFVLFTRPEPEIRGPMKNQKDQVASRVVLHDLDQYAVRLDIEAHLRDSLEPIQPSDVEMKALVERVGNLFAYAAAVVRYISYHEFMRNPRRRLANMLEPSPANALQDNYSREIDSLYSSTLQEALENPNLGESDKEDMRQVLYVVVCAQEPLTIDSISSLLNMGNADRVRAALQPLWSVLHVSEENNLVRTFHSSFSAYILDISRSRKYCCDPKAYSQTMAQHCFRIFRDVRPQFNICGLSSSYIPDNQVDGLEERVHSAISNDLFYAAQNWAIHLSHAYRSPGLLRELEEFLSVRLLLWMEVMNLKKRAHIMPENLRLLKNWDNSRAAWIQHCSTDLRALINDAWLFTTLFALGAVSNSTPHIYTSMLPFWPQSSPIARCYAKRAREVIWISGTAMDQRQYALLATWHFDDATQSPVYSADGSQIAVGVGNDALLLNASNGRMMLSPFKGHMWDARDGQVLKALLPSSDSPFRSMDISLDGTRIAAGSIDKSLHIWNTELGQRSQAVLGSSTSKPTPVTHNLFISVSFSPDGSYLISSLSDGRICLWDTRTGGLALGPLHGHTDNITSLSFSHDGAYIISGSYDKTLRVWDTRIPHSKPDPLRGHTGSVTSLDFSPDGAKIVSSSTDQTVRVWDAEVGRMEFGPFEQNHDNRVSVAYSPSGTRIICNSRRGLVLLNAQTGNIEFGPFRPSLSIQSAALSSDGASIILGLAKRTVQVIAAVTGKAIVDICTSTTDQSDWLTSALPSPDGACIAVGSIRSSLSVYDARSGKLLYGPFEGHNNESRSFAFSPDGTRIVHGSSSTIFMRDAQSGKVSLWPLTGHTDWVHSVEYSTDGTQIVSGARDNAICVWDTQTGRPVLGPVKWHTAPVRSVRFSPDGKYVASGSDDKTIRLTDVSKEFKFVGPATQCEALYQTEIC
ncbi:hypothetical protein FRC11_011601 [Ceratobasidium sp. 423]|nr:hypothetical protein FRC11_011601 [Ceratobasidium sp. 423]